MISFCNGILHNLHIRGKAIGTRHNAVPEIILDDETGLLVPVGDAAALMSAMRALIDSAGLRARLGARARDVIERTASPQRYLDELTALVLHVSRQPGAGATST